ncbi:hydroxyacid dehydrogenase [Selenomonas sp. oral taxon 126]|uniref:D-2-hydroxyacid dehydrogenase n=1 Tax=Selenomonas sp. oral taxon 126 TaxID=712528 RepID=UPI0008077CAB|nr:D-2-hydroxyacid dehydrogenase [Selenomonas sp. oral taxon 126]ANR70093.1 hydroxyacid dehydrogenase [Selenomonas sp. oral taxon 126]
MKIVVLDGYTENPGDISWAPLEALGEVTVYDRTSLTASPLIAERIGDAEIAVTNKTPLTRAVIDACPNLRAIAVLATGYNVVDTAYAREKNIPVMNVPVYGTDNVAQYAIALLLEACSQVGLHDRSVHAGDWTKNIDFCYWQKPLIEVSGKTAGIIGFGRIGMAVARILRAMNVRVLAYSRTERPEGRACADYVPLDDLIAQSDFIFLHCPLTPETEGIVNAANIARMKDGVIIVNNGRGQLVVEADLAAALTSGKVAYAAVDVASTEPIRADNPLLTAPNCIITPHISWATKEARARIMQMTAENVKSFIDGKPMNVVN